MIGAVVIGAGTAGLVVAAGAAGLGARVALVERHLMGGDCLNFGCVPSKGMISAGRIAASVRDAAHFGVNVPEGWGVDFGVAMQRMRKLRAGISGHDSAARFRDLGIDVFLSDERNRVFPDRASQPDRDHRRRTHRVRACPDLCPPWLRGVSRRGYHGILPREDPEAAKIVRNSLVRDGVHLLCCGRETKVRKDGDQIRLYPQSHGKSYDEPVDKLLVAVGRATASALTIPWCTYTSPEIAHVGLYPKEEKGIATDTYTQELDDVDLAILEGETDGFVRIHVKKGTDKIVGATIVAVNAGDMISEVNRSRLTPFVKSLFQKWLAWAR